VIKENYLKSLVSSNIKSKLTHNQWIHLDVKTLAFIQEGKIDLAMNRLNSTNKLQYHRCQAEFKSYLNRAHLEHTKTYRISWPAYVDKDLNGNSHHYSFYLKTLPKSFNQHQRDALTGTLMGDGSFAASRGGYCFGQSRKHRAYVHSVYELFHIYCSKTPRDGEDEPDNRTDTISYWTRIVTMSHPNFQEFKREHYFIDDRGIFKRRLPRDFENSINARVLAY